MTESPVKVANGDAVQPVTQAAAAAQTTINTPPGYWGNLSDAQQEAFDKFKQDVEAQFGATHDASTWFDDSTLLRFLRARKFHVERAMQQFSATDAWRREQDVEGHFRNAETSIVHESRRHYPRFLGRRDKFGRLIFVFRPGSLTQERQSEIFRASETERMRRIVNLTELVPRFWNPLGSFLLAEEHPITTEDAKRHPRIISEVMSIVDLDGASLGQLWKLRNHLAQASTLASAHYPETLGQTAIVNAPAFFSTIWSWINKWFDEGTRKKMFVVSVHELHQGRLLELIDKEDLPRIYGGQLTWQYEDEPALSEEINRAMGGVSMVPSGTAAFQDGRLIVFDPTERAKFPNAVGPEV